MDIPRTILVLTDREEGRELFRALCNEKSYQLMFKEKTNTSLRIFTLQKFDLVFIDIHKPTISEVEFYDRLFDVAYDIPIIIVSEYFYETRQIVFENKYYDYILKPVTLEKLTTSVDNLFEKKETVQAKVVTEPAPEMQSRKLLVLLEIARRVGTMTDLNELLKIIINHATEALDSERATVFIVDKEKNEIWSRIGTRIGKKEIRLPIGKGIAGKVALTGKPLIVDDPYSTSEFVSDFDKLTNIRTRNILCVPMFNIKGEVIGIFELLNKKSGSFDRSDEEFLSIMAASTGIAIENTMLHEKLLAQYDDVKKSYDELYESQGIIIKQTKASLLGEIESFVKDELEGAYISQKLEEIKNSTTDFRLRKMVFGLLEAYRDTKNKIESFLQQLKENK